MFFGVNFVICCLNLLIFFLFGIIESMLLIIEFLNDKIEVLFFYEFVLIYVFLLRFCCFVFFRKVRVFGKLENKMIILVRWLVFSVWIM